jgi:hypothetical protein
LYGHVDVYLDESGDLGFSDRSSKHLVVVALATAAPHTLARIVRRAHRKFSLDDGSGGEFKFNRSREPLRRFFLESMAETDSWIVWGSATKSGASRRSLRDGGSLWGYVASRTVSEMSRATHAKSIHLVVDRFSPRPNANRSLAIRLVNEVEAHHAGHFPPKVKVSLVDSRMSEGLQVADHVAGAVFQSVERGESSYLRMIERTVVRGEVYW